MCEGNSVACLDVASLRAEIEERPEHLLERGQKDALLALPDAILLFALNISVDDGFWSEYDNVRSVAISVLLAKVEGHDE